MKTLAPLVVVVATACASTRASSDPRVAEVAVEARAADVVYFGEAHDDRRQHQFERDLLVSMAGDGPLLLGMEMFQRPFQKPLDDYVAGKIDEKEMLRRTEYFSRWSFDYTFYAPMWRWCRAHHARIVALNTEASISRKVGRDGFDALTDDERSQIAASVDLGIAAHRERIMGMFTGGAHQMPPDKLEKLYQAMTVWDDTMADSAVAALAAAGPGARMLVVAGRGHVEDFTGIPDRVARRMPGLRRVVIVGDETDDANAPAVRVEDCQFVVSFPAIEKPAAPKLGVAFDTTASADGLVVQSVVVGGAAAKAGVAAGDVLCRLGDAPVRDMVDVRWIVDSGKTGDVVRAEVLRGGVRVPLSIRLEPPPAEPPPPKK